MEPLLSDTCPEVQAVAAWALSDRTPVAAGVQNALRSALKQDQSAALFALNVLDWSGQNTGPYADLFEPLLASNDPVYAGYLSRMVTHLRETRSR
jgi:hypothetical protein